MDAVTARWDHKWTRLDVPAGLQPSLHVPYLRDGAVVDCARERASRAFGLLDVIVGHAPGFRRELDLSREHTAGEGVPVGRLLHLTLPAARRRAGRAVPCRRRRPPGGGVVVVVAQVSTELCGPSLETRSLGAGAVDEAVTRRRAGHARLRARRLA